MSYDIIGDFLRYGAVEFEAHGRGVRATFTGKPFMEGVPASLRITRETADDAVLDLWNLLVDELVASGAPSAR